ncbi:toll/interleukin-1 receptor domain-containing protein [Nodosilinea nodulosa]|uniref:toll/interleukin-1 receptor domain-containing protein n=1 Tax=Nodosilinea nodulosa TaxID=416001 RepID=UPI0008FB82F0|nr:toll/interleukin-1 receptor domain-containing protein [Nodosilinea nodulosa]
MTTQPLSLFISYSHRDEALKQELEEHLALLKRQNLIQTWHDGQIEAGTEWNAQILDALDSANIILLLISSRFISSDFCYGQEMQRAMQRHQSGDARVVPIILTPTDWAGAPFDKLQVLPKHGKPVVEWSSHDAAFLDVVRGIRRVIESLSSPEKAKSNKWDDSARSQYLPISPIQTERSISAENRIQFYRELASLPEPQFEQVLFALNPPAGNVPRSSASQASRVISLLQWAESPVGPGLSEVNNVLHQVIGRAENNSS